MLDDAPLPFCCVECGCEDNGNTAYVQYSEGSIRLKRCVRCSQLVDKYIEFEWILIIIDIILFRVQAYRHVLRNVRVSTNRYLRLYVLGILMRSYIQLYILLLENENAMISIEAALFAAVELIGLALAEQLVLIGALKALVAGVLKQPLSVSHILRAVIISNYSIVICVPMTIWEYPFSFVLVVELVVFFSTISALNAIVRPNSPVWIVVTLAFTASLALRLYFMSQATLRTDRTLFNTRDGLVTD